MPSGKKARGRKNRAKKDATLTAAQRTLWEQVVLRNDGARINATTSCEHVLAVPRIPQEGPAVSFMNFLAGDGFFSSASLFNGEWWATLSIQLVIRFPGVWKEESERSQATDLLLRFLRNVFVHDSKLEGANWFHQGQRNEAAICCAINTLEISGTYSDVNVAMRRAYKMNCKLAGGNRRDTVKFLAKRLPCACLKKLHSAARKKLAKVGTCVGCKGQFPRSQLQVCTGCMANEYCSKECQTAHWSYHKQHCGIPEVMRRDLPADYIIPKI